ncbi:hypothetical protein Gotur_008902 [Gossypium turneri]
MQRRFNLLRENNDIVKSMGMLKEEVKGNQHGHSKQHNADNSERETKEVMEKRVSKPRTPPMTVRRSTVLQRENDPPHLNSKGETSTHCKRVITVGKQAITRKLDHQRLTTIHVPQPKGGVQSLPTVHPQPFNNVEAGATPLNITEDEKKKEKMGRSRGTVKDNSRGIGKGRADGGQQRTDA